MKHLTFGGSTASRTMNCPAWHKLSEDIPRSQSTNEAAEIGTMLHNAMEILYQDDGPTTAAELLAAGHHYKEHKLTQEHIDTKLTPAIEAVEDLMDKYDVQTWMVEPFIQIADDIGGSIDLLMISADEKTVLVIDYKFGYVGVSAGRNAQLSMYALCADNDEKTNQMFNHVDTIKLVVIQPNENGSVMDSYDMTLEDLDNFETVYMDCVAEARMILADEAPADPSPGKHCQYCPAHATCPAKTGLALKATRMTDMQAENLAEYLPIAEEVIAWAKEVQSAAHGQLEQGVAIKGYKLVNKRARRVWNDQAAVEDKVRKAKKIKIEDGFTMTLKTPPQLEKLCKELEVDFNQYDKYISSVSSGTTLALESDTRPAAIPVQGLAQLNALNT